MALPAIIDDDLNRISDWIETVTGFELDAAGAIRTLDTDRWQERHDRLTQLGGAPKVDSGWLFEPTLYGLDPCTAPEGWANVIARPRPRPPSPTSRVRSPHLSSAWLERGLFYAKQSEPEKAMAELRSGPDARKST